MGKKCVICGTSGTHLFQFPSHQPERANWFEIMVHWKQDISKIHHYSVICKDHFTPESFSSTGSRCRLTEGAVPSILGKALPLDTIAKPLHILNENEQYQYIRELLTAYKNLPVLWQRTHPHYTNKAERYDAYNIIAAKCQKYNPDCDIDSIRSKIDSLRSCFRKERRKVVCSKLTALNNDGIHKPSLWYYDLLLFIAGEEAEDHEMPRYECDDQDLNRVVIRPNLKFEKNKLEKISYWTRDQSAMLINFYKKYPCLYSDKDPLYKSKKRRIEAVEKITASLCNSTGKQFKVSDVRKKISLLRGQFLHEYKKVLNNQEFGYKSSSWCYELLSFLKSDCTSKDMVGLENVTTDETSDQRASSSSDVDEEDLDLKKRPDSSLSSESIHIESIKTDNDDIYDVIAKNFAHRLRDMTEEQRNIADRIIRDVMYHGQMENLTQNSKLNLDN